MDARKTTAGRVSINQYYEIVTGPKVRPGLPHKGHRMSSLKAYISRSALWHNIQQIRRRCASHVRCCAVVKADAYGHDAVLVADALAPAVDALAVVAIDEAEAIHHVAGKTPILTMRTCHDGIEPELIELAAARGFWCTISSLDAAAYVTDILKNTPRSLDVHVKIDTGMGRGGVLPENLPALLTAIDDADQLRLTGVYTHFATADDPDPTFALQQNQVFTNALAVTGLDRREGIIRHTCNSPGTFRFPQAHWDMVRPGLAVYGHTNERDVTDNYGLRGVLRLEAPLIQTKLIHPGQSCGYDRTFIADRDTLVGLAPVGYADGVDRRLSNRGVMRIGDDYAQIIGRVSMDQTILALPTTRRISQGDTVVVIDDQPDSPCGVPQLAATLETVCQEVLVAIGKRVQRVIVD